MKKLFAILISINILFLFTACTSSNMDTNSNHDSSTLSEENSIGDAFDNNSMGGASDTTGIGAKNTVNAKLSYDEAKEAALKDAGLNKEDVSFLRCELDHDDGTLKYEVEFKKDGVEYEYDIDANTGEVLWADKDFD